MFVCDLSRSRLVLEEYDLETIQDDLEYFGLKNVEELEDPEWRIFKNEADGEAFIEKYKETEKELKKKQFDRGLPYLLCDKNQMILALLGVKLSTVRRHKIPKKWTPGQRFNLWNQKIGLTCVLKKQIEIEPNLHRFEFEIA